jgi:hypothetical protein
MNSADSGIIVVPYSHAKMAPDSHVRLLQIRVLTSRNRFIEGLASKECWWCLAAAKIPIQKISRREGIPQRARRA